MSLFYMSVRNITKAKQSAVASASYRSGEALYSDRDQELKSYKEREVKPDSFILAPEHAPEWVKNREKLWNEVEAIEKNWNARLSREVLVALPRELNESVQKELLVEFCKENFIEEGMVADVSIHRDREENPHAHIMLTVRPFNEDGSWGNKKKREYVLDENGEVIRNKDGKKKFITVPLTNWDKKETLLEWRKNFAEKINSYYLQYDIPERVSHESYEEQGIDKLPKQRLTREEYAIEKEEKEKSLREGKDYQPRTFYGLKNKAIEEANKEIERISKEIELKKQKVVSLSDYKEVRDNKLINDLNQVRKQVKLSSDDWKSLKIVANRVTGFVDLNKAQDNIKKLDNWKKKLELQKTLLAAEESVLSKAKHTYENEPSKTLLYGFSPKNFKEEFIPKVNSLREKQEELNKSLLAFDNLYKHSVRVLEIQKQFANEEFAFLYPQYADKLADNDKTNELKSKYVELFRNEAYVRQSLPELEKYNYKLENNYVKLEALMKDWTHANKSLMILERSKEKYKAEYRENHKNYNAEKVYNSFVKYSSFKEQIEDLETHKLSLKNDMFEQFKSRYSEFSEDILRQIPSDIQVKVLNLHLNNEHTGKLSDDLSIIKERSIRDIENKVAKNLPDDKNDTNTPAKDTGEMLNVLINMSKEVESRESSNDKKLKYKKKPKMLYKELEREM